MRFHLSLQQSVRLSRFGVRMFKTLENNILYCFHSSSFASFFINDHDISFMKQNFRKYIQYKLYCLRSVVVKVSIRVHTIDNLFCSYI